jgi:hypothetical protein
MVSNWGFLTLSHHYHLAILHTGRQNALLWIEKFGEFTWSLMTPFINFLIH